MSIRWIRNILLDGKKTTIEVMLGAGKIADKCYVRIDGQSETWFTPSGGSRDEILNEGIHLLKNRLDGRAVYSSQGSEFNWS